MAKTYEELLEQAAIIRDETAAGKNTATRVGGTITEAVEYVKELKDTYAGIHAEAAAAKQAAAAANTKNAEQDGKISSLEAKDATHDTKIAKIEERVLQYLYPKIYQINEGAGARVFHGFYKGSASVSDERKTSSEEGYSYKVVFKSGNFYLQEISPEGVTVLYSSWAEISLPNNESIASSESYAQRDCLYYIYAEGEGCTYYYIDSNGAATEQSATYLLRLLANNNAADIATLQGKDAAQDEKIAGLQSVQNHGARNLSLSGRVLQMKDMYGLAVGDSVTFPDNGNLYEGTAGASSVPVVFAKTFGGTVTATLGAATSARAGVMTIDHLKRISKLEERVMQYLYPKIYQINEGAGARVFDGFTKETCDGELSLTKDTYRYSVLYSTTQKQFVLNVTDEASGAGVRVGTFTFWREIILPNGSSIASSDSYAQRDCLYYIYVEGEGSTYYYIDSNGEATEKSATYLLRLLANNNAADIATLQGKDAAQDVEIATLHERDKALDGKISALEAKDIEHNAAIVAIQGKDATQDGKISSLEAKDSTHDTKIAKIEERVMQYLYPKIYQLNEGAGARVFHGFYKGSASVYDERKTSSEEGYSYKVVFKSGSFYLQEISPEGVTVLYSSWAEISLPNNESIASSESYAQRDCLYYIYVEGEGCTYYYIDSNGAATEQSATYLLRLLANKNAADIATLQGKDAAQDEKIATLHEHDTALDGKISALEAKDIEHNSAIVRNATVEYYDNSVTDGPSRINTRATFKFFGADNNQLFMATLLGAGNGYPGLLSLKNKTKLDGYADTFPQNPVASLESNGLMSVEDKRKLDSVGGVIDLPWDDEVQGQDWYINTFTERGEYHIHGKRIYDNDGLPIINSGDEHTIDGLMTVLDSSLPNGKKYDVCVTQILRLNNRKGGDGHVYVRTGIAATKSELKRSDAGGWSPWEKLMGVFEKNAVSNATDLNKYTSSGMYDGMFVFSSTSQTAVSGLKIESGSTFLMVSVNGYAVAQTGVVPQVTQLLYVMPSGLDGSSGVRNAKLYTRTGIYVASTKTYTWGKFDGLAYASDISKLASYIQENSDLIQENQSAITANTKEIARVSSKVEQAQETADRAQDAAQEAKSAAETAQTAATSAQETANSALGTATAASTAAQEAKTAAETAQSTANGKQDALTLTVKDNGNIVLANIQGQSKEFMPATPSGDPMHYAYVTAGAEYNDTGADIVKDAPWADMLDDDYDGPYGKTVVHKAGYWYLNGFGDITNEEIRKIYIASSNFPEADMRAYFGYVDFRTNFSGIRKISGWLVINAIAISDGSNKFSILNLSFLKGASINMPSLNKQIVHILGTDVVLGSVQNLSTDTNLITAPFKKLMYNLNIGGSPVLSVKSVLYMINNEKATSPITITLHADVYNRCMANADILAALEAHTNISLASA